MSPTLVAPLIMLAALLVLPGRMPEGRGLASTTRVTTHLVAVVLHRLHVR